MPELIFVLRTEIPGTEQPVHVSAYLTEAALAKSLHQWARDVWIDFLDTIPDLGEPPENDAEMFSKFEKWSGDYEMEWVIYRDVPLQGP